MPILRSPEQGADGQVVEARQIVETDLLTARMMDYRSDPLFPARPL